MAEPERTRRALGLYLALLVAELAPRPAGVSRHDVEAPLARGKRCGRWITGWLRSRFGDPDEGSGQDGGAESADADVCAMDWPLPPGGEPALQERFRRAAATVGTALLPLSDARPSVATTLLEEYLETVTSYVLGRSELVAFFERCVVPVVPEVQQTVVRVSGVIASESRGGPGSVAGARIVTCGPSASAAAAT